jgi:hypothetical protein
MKNRFKLLSLSILILVFIIACQDTRFQSDYFEFASERDAVEFKAEIKQVPEYVDDNMVYFCRTGVYNGRQIVYKGVSGQALITGAHRTTDARIIWNKEVPSNRYIAEIIVPESNEDLLYQEFAKAVDQKFEIESFKETHLIEVYELNFIDGQTIQFEETDASSIRWSQRDGKISGVGITPGMLSGIIERITKQKPVFSNIESNQRYAIDLEWEEGNMDDLNSKLREFGLELDISEREVQILIVNPARTET